MKKNILFLLLTFVFLINVQAQEEISSFQIMKNAFMEMKKVAGDIVIDENKTEATEESTETTVVIDGNISEATEESNSTTN